MRAIKPEIRRSGGSAPNQAALGSRECDPRQPEHVQRYREV